MSRRWIVLFDWDGTLINSLDLKVHNAGILFEGAFGIPAGQVKTVYRRHSGVPRRQLFEAICRENGLSPLEDEHYNEISRRFTEMNQASIIESGKQDLITSDTLAALENLSLQGYPLYVSSSADPEEVRAIAGMLGMERFFRRIMGSAPGFSKGKQHVDEVLSEQQADRGEVVFIGDEPADIALGREAGVLTIAKSGTYAAGRLRQEKPDYVIEALSELPGLLVKIN